MAHTQEGIAKHIKAQVCEVNKALLSVKKVVDTRSRVTFDQDGSFIEDRRTGQRMYLQEKQGMYVLKVWTRGESTSGF